ncbi:hypothetical protein AAF712_010100 [Marasmius tenuissimus]|uniref:Heterokaryon incompatibility domain-containing protein n=1 Tax=Marasmius tenuissimus TaxID=585030 RepID=A0ABR2ZPN0_9AGAR
MPKDAFRRFLTWLVGIFEHLVNIQRTESKPGRVNEVSQGVGAISGDERERNSPFAGQPQSNSIPTSPSTMITRLADAEVKLVYSIPLDALQNGTTIDLTPYLTENRYRFIDADAFIHNRILAIHEMPTLPDLYSTISYVWFGLEAEISQLEQEGSFRIFCGVRSDGTLREDGGPINVKVLEHACRWASNSSSSYLWLDRLCILQTSKQDKTWQISRMYDIYAGSEQCTSGKPYIENSH